MDWKENTFRIIFSGDDDEFWYFTFKKKVLTEKFKETSYWNKTLKTCQTLKQNVFNVTDSELKIFQRVCFWSRVITQQSVGFQVKFFGSCQSLNFDFINKQSVFSKQMWNFIKNWIFLPLYKRYILHSACISKMHYWDWKFSKNPLLSWNLQRVRFWIEWFSTCQIQKYNF